jgi:tRNA(adenine34) deaminase
MVSEGDASAWEDVAFMQLAIGQARLAAAIGEVPIGAVVVCGGEVIAVGYNRREVDADPSAHAEFRALIEASRRLGRWRLTGCTVYVTLEPCLMCAGLMQLARVDRCVFGAADPKGGALGTLYEIHNDARLNHSFEVSAGVCEQECAALLTDFFAQLRMKKMGEAGKAAGVGASVSGSQAAGVPSTGVAKEQP